MAVFTDLANCESLAAVPSCDDFHFVQFFEMERLDRRREPAVFTGNPERGGIGKASIARVLEQLGRFKDVADALKDQRPEVGLAWALAEREQKLGLTRRGARAATLQSRNEFLQTGRLALVGKPGAATEARFPPGLIRAGRRDALRTVTNMLTRAGIVPAPPGTPAPGRATWGLGVEYRQRWCSTGYARGRLVRSVALTPNETVDIVTRTWRKRSEQRQFVESIEKEISTEFIGDEKWSQATHKELTAGLNGGVNGNATSHAEASIPIEVVTVSAGTSAGVGGDLGGDLRTTVGETTERVSQQTFKAASRLKSTVTSTVDMVSEVGSEVTATQRLSNPNRCHSLTFHFFQVDEQWRVETRPTGIGAYLLVPIPRPVVTPTWLLCHECQLRPLLPCDVFYRGFDAARLIEARRRLGEFTGSLDSPAIEGAASALELAVNEIVRAYTKLANAGISLGSTETDAVADIGGAIVDGIGDLVDAGQDFIEGAINTGQEVFDTIVETGGDIISAIGNFFGIQASAAPGAQALTLPGNGPGGGGAGSYVYFFVLETVAPELVGALEGLAARAASLPPAGPDRVRALHESVNAFFASAGDIDEQLGRVDLAIAALVFAAGPAAVGAAIAVLGFPVAMLTGLLALTAAVAAAIADGADVLDFTPDDEGLQAAIRRARGLGEGLATAAQLPPVPGPQAPPEHVSAYMQAAEQARKERTEAAEAAVELDRLTCHIDSNIEYYAQAIYVALLPAKVQALIQQAGIPLHAVEQRAAGFVGMRVAFRVRAAYLAEIGFDLAAQVKRLKLTEAFRDDVAVQDIVMPSQGITVEPQLGQCEGCDEFVETHRALDIENRQAEVEAAVQVARQQKAEADRLVARVSAGELSDPTPFESPATRVLVTPDAGTEE